MNEKACPFFDWDKHKCTEIETLEQKMDGKTSIKTFNIFIASAGAFLIFLSGTLLTMNYKGLEKVDKLTERISSISEKQIEISTNQKQILKKLGLLNDKNYGWYP